jgi:hypothetical protein
LNTITKYPAKPSTVSAVQWDGENYDYLVQQLGSHIQQPNNIINSILLVGSDGGGIPCEVGDWIVIEDEDGERWVFSNDEFTKRFVLLDPSTTTVVTPTPVDGDALRADDDGMFVRGEN